MKYVLCLLICLSAKLSVGQNLVPNPSFEEKLECPYADMLVQPNACVGWYTSRLSSDYMHRCSDGLGIPQNGVGFQDTYNPSDSAYAGVITYATGNANYREHMRCTLISPLMIGTKYYVSFKTSLADSAAFATDRLGIQFTTVPYLDTAALDPNPSPINNFAHLQVSNVTAEANEWTTVSGSFIADSEYTQLLVGNFYDSSLTTIVQTNGWVTLAFYYIDDVCVSTDSLECDLSTSLRRPVQLNFSLYPNPSHQTVNLTLPQGTTQIEIFNAVGQSVYTSNVASLHQAVDVRLFSEGIYFVRVRSHQGVQTQKFVVQH